MKQVKKLITCIVPEGIGRQAVESLYQKFGTASADFHLARGIGKSSSFAKDRMGGIQSEKDVISVVVSADQAGEIFDFLYHEAKIDRPHGGLIYLKALSHASYYSVPEDAIPLSETDKQS